MRPDRHNRFCIGLTLLLCLLAAGGFFIRQPERVHTPLNRQARLPNHHQWDLPLTGVEQRILAPAEVISRKYRGPDGAYFWLTLLQADTIGQLHNLYDCLWAGGTRPQRLRSVEIPTSRGLLRASLIRFYENNGVYDMLLWYQGGRASAEGRIGWYKAILAGRLRGEATSWRLVSVSRYRNLDQKPDFDRLAQAARMVYEARF
jgi:hypothetical protein